jgi:flagellar motility protein MotE (MotC chaperone)
MAKKAPEPILVEPDAPRNSALPIVVWIFAAVFALGLLFAVLHLSGALNGPEEKLYQKAGKSPGMRALLHSFHHSKYKENLKTDDIVNLSETRKELSKAIGDIESLTKQNKDLKSKISDLESNIDKIDKIEKDMKTLKETGPQINEQQILAILNGQSSGGAAPAASAAPASVSVPTMPQAQTMLAALRSKDYGKVTKILSGMPAETAADVLTAIAVDDEDFVVQVLSQMKPKTSSAILQTLDAAKSGELLKKLSEVKQAGT